jgi:hypothetical protein
MTQEVNVKYLSALAVALGIMIATITSLNGSFETHPMTAPIFAESFTPQDPVPWKAVSEFGLAIVLAVSGFFYLLMYVRRAENNRETEVTALRTRVTSLESFQQSELLDINKEMVVVATQSVEITKNSVEATNSNTDVLKKLSDNIAIMNANVRTRPCFAIAYLPEKERKRVIQIIQEHLGEVEGEIDV